MPFYKIFFQHEINYSRYKTMFPLAKIRSCWFIKDKIRKHCTYMLNPVNKSQFRDYKP